MKKNRASYVGRKKNRTRRLKDEDSDCQDCLGRHYYITTRHVPWAFFMGMPPPRRQALPVSSTFWDLPELPFGCFWCNMRNLTNGLNPAQAIQGIT